MINVFVSVDENYLKRAYTTLFSLKEKTNEDVHAYLLNCSLSDEKQNEYNSQIKKYGMTPHIIQISQSLFKELPTGFHYTMEMYSRMIAPFLLPNTLDRALWLDADIIVLKDISDFYYRDFKDKKMIACSEWCCNMECILSQKEKLGIAEEHVYFNSGMLLLNLEKLRNDISADEILRITHSLSDKLVYPDQDVLNYIYQGAILYENADLYNCQNPRKEVQSNIVILHCVGKAKPWKLRYMGTFAAKEYWKIRFRQGDVLPAVFAFIAGPLVCLARNIWHLFGGKL
jgi:lipopolysaccharide biosynthesis glycosyltransferase